MQPTPVLSSPALWGSMLAASFASTIGGLPFNALPILLGTLADSFKLGAAATGLLGSSCFAGYLLGTLLAALYMDRLNWPWLTRLSALGAAGALLLSSQLPLFFQYPLWAVVGFFAALMTCLGLRIMGALPDKERALSVRLAIELAVTSLVLFVLPPLVIARWHYPGLVLALSAIILLLSLSSLKLPRREALPGAAAARDAISIADSLHLPWPAFAALACFFVYGTGQIGLWAFLERIGHSHALSASELGLTFAVLKLLGGAAAGALILVGDRLGYRWPHGIVLLVITAGLLLMSRGGFAGFAIGAWVWEAGFTWGCIYQTAAIARLDPSGRSVMLIPAAFALAAMLGPGLAGFLSASGFAPLYLLAAATAGLPILVYTLFLARSMLRPASPQAGDVAQVADVL
ncbi:MFS transporter [Craterilacuibacter sp.]|uniref:MFS transporter n=1 Tax=Craterilacuibacter sp. TaxID=2870909 RepID=UPI003F328780